MMNAAELKRGSRRSVMVSPEDASMVKRVHRILESGKDVEIRKGKNGLPKILKVSKEVEEEE